VLQGLADPISPKHLAETYRVWRQRTAPEEEKVSDDPALRLLRGCDHVEEFLWPRAGRDWLDTVPADLSMVALRLATFRDLLQRWQAAVLLPIDQLLLTVARPLPRAVRSGRYLVSLNNYDFPSALPGDRFIAEKWFTRDGLNLETETVAQLRALADLESDYVEGRATAQARLDYAAERLRLLYVGITRARKELIMTWNTGHYGDQQPAAPFIALQTLWGGRDMRLPADFRFSPSSLQDYVDCPRRFLLRHVQQVAWPALVAEPALENERRMRLGAAFHRLVRQHFLGIPPALSGADPSATRN
jgi:hypothetical protein